MARHSNAYAKRQRDLQKKQKSEDKKARRVKRKENVKGPDDIGDGPEVSDGPQDISDGDRTEDGSSPASAV